MPLSLTVALLFSLSLPRNKLIELKFLPVEIFCSYLLPTLDPISFLYLTMTILKLLLSYLSIHPSPLRNPSTSLHLSQQAPSFLASSESTRDTQETWLIYEQLLLSCLRTGDDKSARLCLQRLSDRFGVDSARVKALAGLYDEATANSRGELEAVLKRYQDILKEDPTNMVGHSTICPLMFLVQTANSRENKLAGRKAAYITFVITWSPRRGYHSFNDPPVPFTYRLRILGTPVIALLFSGTLPAIHILPGGGPLDSTECLQYFRSYW